MHSVSLNHFSNFILVLNSMRNHSTKNECFCMYILFTTIYLLHKQKLNDGNYSEQELSMGHFVQANDYDAHMYTKLQYACKYRYFNTNLTLFCLFSIYIIYCYETILICRVMEGQKFDVMGGNISKI
jgi:hypothetical protein